MGFVMKPHMGGAMVEARDLHECRRRRLVQHTVASHDPCYLHGRRGG